jgi:DedD protein
MQNNENNELNDIILNQNGGSLSGLKKIILTVAVLAVILILVLVIMNVIGNRNDEQNVNTPTLPPIPKDKNILNNEPLFEPLETIKDTTDLDETLRTISNKLEDEKENTYEKPTVDKDIKKQKQKQIQDILNKSKELKPSVLVKPVLQKPKTENNNTSRYFVQVASFLNYNPKSKFIQNIKDKKYEFIVHKVNANGKLLKKILIGPYKSREEAKKYLNEIKKDIIKGAWITKV